MNQEYITIALPKGKMFKKAVDMLAKCGFEAEDVREDSRMLIISNEQTKVRFIITKTVDLPTYVECGAADIGIIGKDVLVEENKDVYELLDLKYGLCRLMLAVPEASLKPNITDYANMRVATKYPHVAEKFFAEKGMQVEIIKLNGSIELAPMVGLSELIVDVVETGTTLKANRLIEVEKICSSTARLIANRVSFRMKFQRLHKLVKDLEALVQAEG